MASSTKENSIAHATTHFHFLLNTYTYIVKFYHLNMSCWSKAPKRAYKSINGNNHASELQVSYGPNVKESENGFSWNIFYTNVPLNACKQ